MPIHSPREKHPRHEPGYTLPDLAADLESLGIRPSDFLIVHASMRRLGHVCGGPATLLTALEHAVTPAGTILMPAFSYCFERVYSPIEPYDPQTSPSKVGLLAETFRTRPGVLRSTQPTHSVAAWGALAREIVACHGPCDHRPILNPFQEAARRGAKVLLIGCDFTSLTLLHAAEEVARSPFLPIFNWSHLGWKPTALAKDAHGRPMQVPLHDVPGCSRSFNVAIPLVEKKGLVREGRLGSAGVLQFEAAPVMETVAAELRRQPDFLLCPPGACRACDDRRVVFEHSAPGAKEIGRFMIDVIAQCGCRLAGSEGEDLAAELIARHMDDLGLSSVTTHRFPIPAWQPGFSELRVRAGDHWEPIESAPACHSPPTEGKAVEGPVVQIESLTDLDKVRTARGAIALLWDGYGQSREDFRRLMRAGFRALIMVDKRFSHTDVVAAGVPAQWVPDFTTPMITLPHPQAVRLFGHGPVHCRVKVNGRVAPGESTIVTGEIPGTGPGVILLSGHHDTTANSAAPDDNLSGVATVLEVARLLVKRKRKPRFTIRFCSFGAEEQLSEGARWYALESGEARHVRFVLNTDSLGARCGTTHAYLTGDEDLLRWFRRQARHSTLQFKLAAEICPFSDQFPFNCLGTPSVWFYRQTITSGRHYHHTVRDTLGEISFDALARHAAFQAQLVGKLAWCAELPFRVRLPARLRRQIATAQRQWFG